MAVPRLILLGGLSLASAQVTHFTPEHPPPAVVDKICSIMDLYKHLTTITANEECRKGCQQGTGICPEEWYPSQADSCSAECGRVFEGFWDECGEMLKNANMGGMEEMDQFYTHCLEELYPPGTCGTFCAEKTYECYLAEVHMACCDEEGTNCVDGQPIPQTCPVGCALVFPEFLETCRDHLAEQDGMDVAEFDAFEHGCLEADGLELVEYALDLQRKGCTLTGLDDGHRRLQMLSQWLDSDEEQCTWDNMNNLAKEIDQVCCRDGACIEAADGEVAPPASCTPSCAVAMHEFKGKCYNAIEKILGADERYQAIEVFEDFCISSVTEDPLFILEAIRSAVCPEGEDLGGGEVGGR